MPKIFVLDTSVLLFDHNAINNFEEHNIIIPITVLEELDQFKVGNNTLNFEAREVIRFLDDISSKKGLNEWIKLGKGKGKVKIAVATEKNLNKDAEIIYGKGKNDHKILNVALMVKAKQKKTRVILVSKDINLRIKSRALGIESEDYLTGKVSDSEYLSESQPSIHDLDGDLIKEIYAKNRITENGILKDLKVANGYYILNNCTQSVLARYDEQSDSIERVEKHYAFGIKPKNAEQTFAMNALLNEDIKLVALEGVAGTGKTLLALAAALEQKHQYEQIILSRPIVPLSNRDIGFLPGDADDKISPYMQPLWDNLKFIKSQHKENSRKNKIIDQLTEDGSIEITALTFIRGRSLTHAYFIVDEAQNLTPHEIKTIITRAGEGTKIVFTGDVNQIDTPYMDKLSNGLSYIIDRLKGDPLFAHIKLEHGERSELANLANRLL
jgi:PhoH-like ATPase